MEKVLVTRQIPQAYITKLEEVAEVEMWDEALTPMPREAFLKAIQDKTACFITLAERIDEAVFEQAPQLKVIANMAVGYDNIDLEAAAKHQVEITNTPDVLTETTAELGFSLMLATARRVVEAAEYVKDGQWESWGPYLLAGKDVYGSKVGIFGMGSIGQAFARRLQGFNADILYHNRTQHKAAEKALGALYVDFDTMLASCDFIVNTAPLTDDTRDVFDAAAFKKMKSDAIFINIGRGATVVEDDLVHALETGEIRACGLDVLREEPIDMTHPLLKMPSAVILPHIGSASVVTRNRMIQLCVRNICAVLRGDVPLTPVKK